MYISYTDGLQSNVSGGPCMNINVFMHVDMLRYDFAQITSHDPIHAMICMENVSDAHPATPRKSKQPRTQC